MSRSASEHLPREWLLVLLGSLMDVAGSGFMFIAPGFLNAAGDTLRLTASQIGVLSGVEGAAVAIACIVSSRRLVLAGWTKMAIVAGVVCIAANIATSAVDVFTSLIALRAVAGLAEGILYTASFAVLGRSKNPERAFGFAMTAVVGAAAIILGFQPALVAMGGFGALLWPLAVVSALTVGLIWTTKERFAGIAAAEGGAKLSFKVLVLIAGQAVWFGAPGVFWAFAERIAEDLHASPTAIASAFSSATIVGLAGAFAPVLLGSRIKPLYAVAIGTIMMIGSVAAYLHSGGTLMLALTLGLFNIAWNLSVVYQLAFCSADDPSGMSVSLAPAAQLAGLAVGPVFGGLLISAFGNSSIMAGVGAFGLAGFSLLAWGRRQVTAGSAGGVSVVP